MIAVSLHGDPYPADGEKHGRELLAGFLEQVSMAGEDTSAVWEITVPATAAELAWTALWLRQMVLATVGQDEAMTLEPPGRISWRQRHGWLLAHSFLAGLPPWHEQGMTVCCFNCLAKLTASMVSACGSVIMAMFGGDAAAAAAYIRSGGFLPSLASRGR